jgi:spermidine synthase
MIKLFSRRRIHRACADEDCVNVSEKDGVRYLHLGASETVQSAMRIGAPYDLELKYTRSMMGFLLFHPEPERILMIGLGGGSLAKFVYHRLRSAAVVAVESSPQVMAAARAYFQLPEPDERFAVELGDGAEYVRAHPGEADVLMVDGFDARSQAENLATQAFYDDCAAALSGDGVLVVNLWGSDGNFDVYLKRIETSFNGLALCLPTEKHSNVIVFAFKRSPGSPRWTELRERARQLEAEYGLEFLRFAEHLRAMNPHTEKRLLV